jgi:hypothetical protein
VAFGVDDNGRPLLATASDDRTVQLWDPTTGTPVLTLLRRTTPTAVAAQGTQLAIADSEGVAIVEVMDGAEWTATNSRDPAERRRTGCLPD